MICVNKLSYSYGDKKVLQGITFQIEPGQLCALFGPNGTGKTTLFKCIMGIHRNKNKIKTKDEIKIDGKDVACLKFNELAKIITYVPQEQKTTFPYLVKEIVLMGRTPHMGGVLGPKKEDLEASIDAMEMIGISSLADESFTKLSGGQRQLVLLARAFAQDTKILLLDEPTSNLDYKNQIMVWNTIKRITTYGKTAMICTHDPNHVMWFCDKVVIISKEGKILAEGDPRVVVNSETLNAIYGNVFHINTLLDNTVVVPYIYDQNNISDKIVAG